MANLLQTTVKNAFFAVALLRQRQSQMLIQTAASFSTINRDITSSGNQTQMQTLPNTNSTHESANSTTFPKNLCFNSPLSSSTSSLAVSQIAQPANQPVSHGRNSPVLPSLTSNRGNSSSTNFRALFPCLRSVNAHMRSREARLQTFLDHSTVWPAHRIRASPQQIVDAGFFYLGNRDRVKCWYCNGGLQNWERDDVPWEEHAKWFPMCEYVLQQKGPSYVHDIVSRFPNLQRPVLANAASGPETTSLRQSLRSGSNSVNIGSSSSNAMASSPIIIDPRKEMMKRKEIIEHEMETSDHVARARLMGFDDDAIKLALTRFSDQENFAIQQILGFVDCS